jgi:pyruvate dehydrogenase E2 component (dihydrolipoamide acetyltransferase)
MAEVIKMPKLSDTMTEGVVAEWHKKVGDKVKVGDLLAEIETDKATMEFESFQEGVLLYIGVEKGQSAPVDSILAILGKEGEDISGIIEEYKKSQTTPASSQVEKTEDKKQSVKEIATTEIQSTLASNNFHTSSSNDGRLKASPLAKKLAKEKGIDLNTINGSGDGGRIVKRDIENYKGPSNVVGIKTPTFIPGKESFTEEAVSQMRKTIARRLTESKFSAPHFYLTIEIDMDKAIEARSAINAISSIKVSYNDLIIKAVAMSLRKHPKINSSWLGDKIRYNEHIHIGVAVAVDEGLLVPVIRFADSKSITQIAEEVKYFAQKAKDKKLQPSDWEGNTFTISNLGMFGIEEFTAIINPPDACILAVGAIKQTPVVKNGQILVGNVMKVTLSCDHRVVDGALGAAFLQTLKQMLENPILMIGI